MKNNTVTIKFKNKAQLDLIKHALQTYLEMCADSAEASYNKKIYKAYMEDVDDIMDIKKQLY